jgi:hypothetical protein
MNSVTLGVKKSSHKPINYNKYINIHAFTIWRTLFESILFSGYFNYTASFAKNKEYLNLLSSGLV